MQKIPYLAGAVIPSFTVVFILIFIVIIFLVIMIEMAVKMGVGGGGGGGRGGGWGWGCYTSAHYDISILLKNKNIKKGVDKPFIVLKMCGF